MKKISIFLIIFFVVALFGCVQQKEEIKIGVLVPETGTFSNVGVGMKNAANLALKHSKDLFGGKYKVKLIFADCGSTPEQAKAAFMQLAAKGVVAIVGAYSSQQAIACADAAKETKTVYIATVASTRQLEKKVLEGNRFVFRISYNSTYWGVLAAKFLNIAKPDHFCFVGYDPLKTFNQEMLKAIEERTSIEKACEFYYKSPAVSPNDVKVVASKTAKIVGDRDVLILGDPGRLSISFLKEYRINGGKGIVYSVGGTLALPATLKKLKANYTAFQAAALDKSKKNEITELYFKDYKMTYGEEANNYASLLTYDSILILIQALNKDGDLITTLEKGEFKGAAGIYKFTKSHTAMWGTKELEGVLAEFIGDIEILYPPEYATSEVIWRS